MHKLSNIRCFIARMRNIFKAEAFIFGFTGILTAVYLYYFSLTVLGLASSILGGFIASQILAGIIQPKTKIIKVKKLPYLMFPLFYSLILVFLQLFQVSYSTPQILDWCNISILGYLKLFFALLIIFFLPGLAFLKILRLGGTLLEKIVFSFIVSLFFTIMVSVFLGYYYIIASNLIVLFLYLFFIGRDGDCKKCDFYLDIDPQEVLTLLFVALVIILGVCANYMNFQLFIGPDTWRHHGVALALLENKDVPIGKFNFFHVLLASIFYLSDFPYINLWSILALFSIVLLFAVYLAFSSLLKFVGKKHVILVSVTIWSLFSGFGSLGYFLYSRSFPTDFNWILNAYLKSYMDIGYPFGFWIYIEGFWPQLIGFISFFSMIYLFVKESYDKRDIFLIICTFIVGYTTHFLEMSFFVILYTSFTLIRGKIAFSQERLLYLSLSEVLTFIISITFVFEKTGRFITFQGDIVILELLSITVATLLLLGFSDIAFINPIDYCYRFARNRISKSLPFLIIFLYSIYILGLLVWFSKISTFDFWQLYPNNILPWYIYPLRFGMAGIFSIIGFKKILEFNGEKPRFLLYSILFSLAFSQILGLNLAIKLFPFLASVNKIRIVFLSFPFISILAGIGFSEFITFLMGKNKKRTCLKLLTLSMVTVFVFGSGMVSTIQTIDFWALHNRNIARGEILALDYIRLNINAKGLNPIIAPSYYSFQLLQAFSGKFIDLQSWSQVQRVFAAKTRQEFVDSLILIGNPQFIYLAQRDIDLLNKKFKGSFIVELLKNSTPVYSTDLVKIYKISINVSKS